MLLPVDVDQFLIVYYITTDYGSINYACLNARLDGFYYLPKELFNMSEIKFLSADLINKVGPDHNYNANTKVTNHVNCRWENFVNLNKVRWLIGYILEKNEHIIRAFRSL